MNEIDVSFPEPETYPKITRKTYEQVIVGDFEPIIELREVVPTINPLTILDLSLRSIIASGNMDLLRPTGTITDTRLSAQDKFDAASDILANVPDSLAFNQTENSTNVSSNN